MALQSGSATVLKRMKRWYNLQQFRRSIRYLRDAIPGIGLTTDVIVGFPGETDDEFRETLEFVEEIAFSKIHVFPFSARRDTAAAAMPGHVAHQTKEARSGQLRELGDELARRYLEQQIGQRASVLLEAKTIKTGDGLEWRSGLTGNYVRAYVQADCGAENEIVATEMIEPFRDGMRGSLLPAAE